MVTQPASPDAVRDPRWLPWPDARWGRDAVGGGALALLGILAGLAGGGLDAAGVLVVLCSCGALAWRRTAPLTVLAVTIAVEVVGEVVAASTDPLVPVVVALYTAVARAPGIWRALTIGVVGAVVTAGVAYFAPLVGGVGAVVVELGAASLAVVLGLAVGASRRTVVAERERAAKDRETAVRRRIAEERVRIARDLHDAVGHQVAVITVQAGLAAHLMGTRPDQAAAALDTVQDAGARVLEELPLLLKVLRQDDDGGEPVGPVVGLERLDDLLDAARAAGTTVELRGADDLPDLAATVDVAAYRVVQEALTNVAKHGDGHATVELRPHRAGVRVVISNGLGDRSGTSGSRLGLVGMRERVTEAGGTLEAGRREERFVVDAWLPGRASPPLTDEGEA